MVTVLIPTVNRPAMLRTALRSVEKQSAKEKIAEILVSENGGNSGSREVCAEFPSLPIRYVLRDPALPILQHGAVLISELSHSSTTYLAMLHDDDWWGINHLATGLNEIERQPDVIAYWATAFLLHGESSWYLQCWNESCWVASGFKPVTEVAKFDRKEAVLACLGSGPAHLSGFIGQLKTAVECLSVVNRGGNLHDGDRLFFFELAKRGPLLVNFVPQVFVRQHPAQDQRSLTFEQSNKHVVTATHEILQFCRDNGIDPVREYEKLYDACPIPSYKPYVIGTMDRRIVDELRRQNALPLEHLLQAHQLPPPAPPPPPPPPAPALKRIARQLCPPILWHTASRVKYAAGCGPEVPEDGNQASA